MSSLGRRIATALVGIPLVLLVDFAAPPDLAFALFFIIFFLAALEILPLARSVAPSAPFSSLLVLIPLASAAGYWLVRGETRLIPEWWLLLSASGMVLLAASVILLSGTEVRDGLAAMGILAFAVPYFAIPPVAIAWLQATDPWLLVVLLAIVWLGDSAAYFIGSAWGRHKLAPAVSPAKSWEGSTAGFAAALLATLIWCQLRLGEPHWGLLVVAAITSIAAQMGDLAESVFKRGAGVKDSSNLLPGHGGFLDRMDAMILAAPIFVAGLRILGIESLIPS